MNKNAAAGLLIGALLIIPSVLGLSGDSPGYFSRGVFIPPWTDWPKLIVGIAICVGSIWVDRSERKKKK